MTLGQSINSQNHQFDYFFEAIKSIEDGNLDNAKNYINCISHDFTTNNISYRSTLLTKAAISGNIDFFNFCCDKTINQNLNMENRFWMSLAISSLKNSNKSSAIFRHIIDNKLPNISEFNLQSLQISLQQMQNLGYDQLDREFVINKINFIENSRNPNNQIASKDYSQLDQRQQDKDKTL